jgi:tetratricopeptide (TPR) repeat protein
MRAKFFFLLLLPLFALHASAPRFSSKAFTLSSEAKKQALCGNTEQAILLFEQALQDPSFRRLDQQTRFELAMSLSEAYKEGKKFSKQEEFVKQLLTDRSYQSYKIMLKSHLGAIYLAEEKIASAQTIMKELLRLPKRDLNSEDNIAIALLQNQIDEYLRSLFDKAKAYFATANYKEAANVFKCLRIAYEKHFVLSAKAKALFLCHLEYSLACCQFLEKNYNLALKTLQDRYVPLYLSSSELSLLYWKGNLLMALCYKHLEENGPCLALLDHIAKTSPISNLATEALWQKALLQPSLLLELDANTDEALYYLARATNDKKHFQKLLETYPESPLAAESYFRLFPDEEYASGNEKAILHLRSMPEKWQTLPFSTLRAYYLGIYDDSISFLEIAITESRSSKPLTPLFLNALLRKAKMKLAKIALDELLSFFSQADDIARKKWIAIWQESLFLQAGLYEKNAEPEEAVKTRKELFCISQKYDAVAGDIVAETLCLLACDASFEESLKLLDIAEFSPHVSRETRLHVLLTRSQLLVEHKKFDEAHHFLSRVINDDFASSLRIQAMFLRADIYEMTERKDLAKKQLDFIIEKGGEWAALAQSRRNQL